MAGPARRLGALLLALVGLAGVGLAATGLAAPALAPSGREIVDAVAARHEQPFEATRGTMILVDASGQETRRRMLGFTRREPDGGYRYLLTFADPPAIAGVAMLAWDHPEAGIDQWLFLPAAGPPKRTVGGSRRGYFLDTDFALEDFLLERRDRNAYTRGPDAPCGTTTCWVVDVEPTDPALKGSTGYARKRVFVDPATYLVLRVDYYERGTEQHIKTMEILAAERLPADILRPKSYRMVNHRNRHMTVIEAEAWSFAEERVPPEMFTPRYLETRRHMR